MKLDELMLGEIEGKIVQAQDGLTGTVTEVYPSGEFCVEWENGSYDYLNFLRDRFDFDVIEN